MAGGPAYAVNPEAFGMAEGLELAGLYFHFGDVEPLQGMRAIQVYRTPGNEVNPNGTLVCRSCDDPTGRISLILSHMTANELALLMECIGTPCAGERRTA